MTAAQVENDRPVSSIKDRHAQLDELEADIEQKEQELRSVKDELAELMSELDKAKLDET